MYNDGFGGGGHDWNGNGHRDHFDEYMDYKASGSDKDDNKGYKSGGGFDFGCGWVVIVIVVIMLISFICMGTTWGAIDSLLRFGFLAFLFARWISR